jgi:hypothetical protein
MVYNRNTPASHVNRSAHSRWDQCSVQTYASCPDSSKRYDHTQQNRVPEIKTTKQRVKAEKRIATGMNLTSENEQGKRAMQWAAEAVDKF